MTVYNFQVLLKKYKSIMILNFCKDFYIFWFIFMMSVFYIYMCSVATKYVFNACSELTMFKISFFKRPCLKSETFMLYIIFMGNSHEIKVKVLSQLVCNFKYWMYFRKKFHWILRISKSTELQGQWYNGNLGFVWPYHKIYNVFLTNWESL